MVTKMFKSSVVFIFCLIAISPSSAFGADAPRQPAWKKLMFTDQEKNIVSFIVCCGCMAKLYADASSCDPGPSVFWGIACGGCTKLCCNNCYEPICEKCCGPVLEGAVEVCEYCGCFNRPAQHHMD